MKSEELDKLKEVFEDELDPENLWDVHHHSVGTDIDELQMVAGSGVMDKSEFLYALRDIVTKSNDFNKARKWDELRKKIDKFYPEDDEDACGDLGDIGEVAASAFGYL